MSRLEPKYRRPLNNDQLLVLRLLFNFRFGSSDFIASYFNKPSGKYVQKRLNILEDQGYIARHYDKSYKLQGKPAAYYLLPKAAKLLQKHIKDFITDQSIKNRYKDKVASERFINHSLGIFRTYLQLQAIYGNSLLFFTKSNLNLEKYDFFPKWLPDSYLSLKGGAKGTGKQHQFFLDLFEETTPFFVLIRRIKNYLSYDQSGEWGGDLPIILMITETTSTQKRLRRRITKELREYRGNRIVAFYTTTKQELTNSSRQNDKIWQLATKPEVVRSLQ